MGMQACADAMSETFDPHDARSVSKVMTLEDVPT